MVVLKNVKYGPKEGVSATFCITDEERERAHFELSSVFLRSPSRDGASKFIATVCELCAHNSRDVSSFALCIVNIKKCDDRKTFG